MPRKVSFFIFLPISIFCLLYALYLAWGQLDGYNASRAVYPYGTTIAGIPVGGLDGQAAGLRLAQVYLQTPLELRVSGTVMRIDPTAVGVQIDLAGMLEAASPEHGQQSYWAGFWDYLMNRRPEPSSASLLCSVAADRLHAYVQEKIAPLFVRSGTRARPIPGDVVFTPGQPGMVLDQADTESKIRAVLCTAPPRVAEGSLKPTNALPPDLTGLGPMLQTLTQVSGYDGVIEIYFQDLKTGKEINFAFNQGREVEPGIAFTGASTIKIPVMISTYKKIDGALPDDLQTQMARMIDLSDNGSTDEVMKQALDPNIAPVEVTHDMQALGMKNTFLAGFFYPGAPLLDRYQTPANQRTDLSTDPDIYNQTTPADMGRLLAAIQRCAADGSGLLTQAFPGKVTQAECQAMTGLLAKNRKGVLIEAGLPEGTQLAHKYGWVTDSTDGLLHTASDAAIVYTPGGDFILTAFLYHPVQLPWDDGQRLVARLATALFNFYTWGK